jgi:hypothetical protein
MGAGNKDVGGSTYNTHIIRIQRGENWTVARNTVIARARIKYAHIVWNKHTRSPTESYGNSAHEWRDNPESITSWFVCRANLPMHILSKHHCKDSFNALVAKERQCSDANIKSVSTNSGVFFASERYFFLCV